MANHNSAKKRNRQSLKRNKVNRSLRSKINNNINRFNSIISSKKIDQCTESFSLVNSSLAKAAKKGLIKKEFVSRKLSSLSNQLKKI
jgi:small subunit ribosomal protein S20